MGRDCWGKDTNTQTFVLWGKMTDGKENWRGPKPDDSSNKWDPDAWPRDSASPGSLQTSSSAPHQPKTQTRGERKTRLTLRLNL